MRRPAGMLLSVALLLGVMGASNVAGRYNALSHQMMCTCGCAQILGECNHVGCPNSGRMLQKLHTDLSGGMGDRAILVAFGQEFGQEALASPMFTRLNEAAWVVPPAVLVLGMLGSLLLLRRWRDRKSVAVSSGTPVDAALLARIRRETGEL